MSIASVIAPAGGTPIRRRAGRTPSAPLADPADLIVRIDALASTGLDDETLRFRVLTLLKETLVEGRAKARERLERTGGGLECAHGLSALQDAIIVAIHHHVMRNVYPPAKASHVDQLAIVAVGGSVSSTQTVENP